MSKILEYILPKKENLVVLVVSLSFWVIAPIPIVGDLYIVQSQRKGIIALLHANGLVEMLHQAFSNHLISGLFAFGIVVSFTGFIAVPCYYISGSNVAISLITCWTLSGFLKIPDGLVPWFVGALVIMPIVGVCFRERYTEESFSARDRLNIQDITKDVFYGLRLKICIILIITLYPFLYILTLVFKGVPNSSVVDFITYILQYYLNIHNN